MTKVQLDIFEPLTSLIGAGCSPQVSNDCKQKQTVQTDLKKFVSWATFSEHRGLYKLERFKFTNHLFSINQAH